jgi:threonyl-tRNA synthetase
MSQVADASEPLVAVLPDGSIRELPAGSTAGDVAADIGPGLAKAAVAAVADGEVVDLMRPLSGRVELRILTEKDPDALPVLRHSAAHVLATAVRALRPGAGIGFGPAIDEGFYYDFEVDAPFTPDDLAAFQAEMDRVIAEDQPFERHSARGA